MDLRLIFIVFSRFCFSLLNLPARLAGTRQRRVFVNHTVQCRWLSGTKWPGVRPNPTYLPNFCFYFTFYNCALFLIYASKHTACGNTVEVPARPTPWIRNLYLPPAPILPQPPHKNKTIKPSSQGAAGERAILF